ncbi:AMP-binding enzyme [Necator americanus]|uniref:AMP-binding enzyme n=1 Tax=Necator americanus TaxID=51031 RepID=W2SF45_NECAM|nr:AMP-binding enzyme [Necator americanus]ETN68239.1 AMP-binding enzyme [Necator americanus]
MPTKSFGMTDENVNRSFYEVDELSHRVAAFLDTLHFGEGDTILMMLPNSSWYPIIFLGGALIGCCMSGINPESSTDEIRYYAKKCGADAVLCEPQHVSKLKAIFTADKILLLSTSDVSKEYPQSPAIPRDLPELNAKTIKKLSEFSVLFDDVLLMPFSSGTGDSPRCVLLTHRNFSAATTMLKRALFDKLLPETRRKTIAILPFYHVSGFWALLYCLLEGCHTIIMKSFHPIPMLEMIEKYEVDTLNVVPSIIQFLCRIDTGRFNLSSLKIVLCGSNSLGKELCKTFLDRFPSVHHLIQGYGMTEAVVLSHISPLGLPDEKHLGSCGKLIQGFEAMLKDESGRVVDGPYKSGELYIKSPSIMLGYLNYEGEDVIVDGWYRTGMFRISAEICKEKTGE